MGHPKWGGAFGATHLVRPMWACSNTENPRNTIVSFENDNPHTHTPGPMYTNCIPPFRLKCEMCGGGLGTVHGGARGNPIIVWPTLRLLGSFLCTFSQLGCPVRPVRFAPPGPVSPVRFHCPVWFPWFGFLRGYSQCRFTVAVSAVSGSAWPHPA